MWFRLVILKLVLYTLARSYNQDGNWQRHSPLGLSERSRFVINSYLYNIECVREIHARVISIDITDTESSVHRRNVMKIAGKVASV